MADAKGDGGNEAKALLAELRTAFSEWDSKEDAEAFDHLPLAAPIDLTSHRVVDLLRLHATLLEELRTRDIVRSSNSPTGDYAEVLFSRAFGWKLNNNSSAGFDATDATGVRYQIKCRRTTVRNPSRQLSFMRNLPAKPFDVLAGLILADDFRVIRAALVPVSVVSEHAKFVAHVNAWRFILRDSVWSIPEVKDVTNELIAAEGQT